MEKRAPYLRGLAVTLALAMLVAGCNLPGTGCRLPQQNGATATNQGALELLNCRALGGDKSAQVTLARAYETGVGVPRDMKKAVRWYKRAATPASGNTPVYMAPVGDQRYGQVQNIQTGPAVPGDIWAQYRLGEIYLAGDGVEQSRRRARNWLRRAADNGHVQAAELLAKMKAEE